jgi:predicted dehydrogenase
MTDGTTDRPVPDLAAQPLRVAVVGLGIGQGHIWALKENRDRFQIVAVADPQAELAESTAANLRGVTALTSFEAVLDVDDIDAICLCTPPSLHAEQITAALNAGRHVIAEKPLVGSLAEVDAIAAAAEAADRWVMPVFQYRYGHGIQKVKHLVETGVAGAAYVAMADVAWRRRPDYYAGSWRGTWQGEMGGVLLSHSIHALDLLSYVLGPVRSVYAQTAVRVNDVETEDCAVVALTFADGSMATLSATLGSPAEISRHRYSFAHLSAESGTLPYDHTGDPWEITADTDEDQAAIDAALSRFEPGKESWPGQFQRLADALEAGAPLPVTLADARASLEVVTACYRSAASGERVTLPITDDDDFYQGWQP